jgi:hypothetical protein
MLLILTFASAAAAVPPTITLDAPTTAATGASPRGMAVADLNRDGVLDLVVANAAADTVSVLLGDVASPGTYATKVDYATPDLPNDVAIADLNRDGVPDLVIISCGCTGGAPLSIFFGNGDGTFGARDDRPQAFDAFAVAVDDLDGDGVLDLVISNEAANTVSVLLGNAGAPGTFLAAATYAVGNRPRTVRIADLDRDGAPDIAVASFGANTISVLLGAGGGTFDLPAVQYPTALGPIPLVVADLNRDGLLDLAAGTTSGRAISVLLGQPGAPGTFGAATNYAVGLTGVKGVAAADLNGDGTLDLVATDGTVATGALVFGGTGTGTFNPPTSFSAGPAPFAVAVEDLDRDGRLDVAIVNRGSANNVGVLRNTTILQPSGVSFATAPVSMGIRAQVVAVGDVNGDGIADIVTTERDDAANTVTVRLGTGNGTFGSAVSPPGPFAAPSGLAVGDVNGDGRLDILWMNADTGSLSAALGNGDGTFAAPLSTAINALGESFLVLGDVDRDGILDAVVSKRQTDRVAVLHGNGDGTFVQTNYAAGATPRIVALADADGDGALDIVVANIDDDTVSVLLNMGNGSFAPKADYAMGAGLNGVAIGDVNADGIADLVSANSGSYSVRLGAGDGTFGASTATTLPNSQANVVITDINRDGRADLVFGASAEGTVTVVPGTGSGAFGPPQVHAITTGRVYAAVGDLDRDGRPDIVTAEAETGKASILLARAATFRFSALDYTGREPDGTATITVTRHGDTSAVMSVRYATAARTATAGDDYTDATGRLTFGVGSSVQTFSVVIANDNVTEDAETVALTLSSPTGDSGLDVPRVATLTIVANDPARLQFNRSSYAINENGGSATITVRREGGVGTTVTVDYATSNGSATAGADYTLTAGTLTFGPGDTSQTFAVPIIDDTVPENPETINLTLSNAGGGAVLGARTTAVLTIAFNDPQPPAITSTNATTFTLGAAGTFTVTTTGFPDVTTITRGGAALPSGVGYTDNGNGTATLAGTPSSGTAGTYAFIFTASNGFPPDAVQNPFTLTVVCPVVTISGAIPPLTVGVAMAPAAFTLPGGIGTITWSASGLPAGMAMDAVTGEVTGTPTVTGTFSVEITVTHAGTCTRSADRTVTVAPVAVGNSYTRLADNTQFVVTGGATARPSTPVVTTTGRLTTNDRPSGGVTATPGTFATSAGGSVTIAADGTFLYTPKANPAAAAATSDSFTYTVVSNTGGGAPVTSAPGTVNLSLAGRVWYVLNDGPVGNGQSHSPFDTLSAAVAASTNDDILYVYRGSGTTAKLATASVLKAGQQLIGQGAALVVNGLTLVAAGGFPRLGSTITLAGGVRVDGVDMSTGAASGIVGTSVTGVDVTVRSLTTTTGTAVAIGGAGNSGDFAFRSVSSDGAVNGISLANFTGSFTVSGDGTSSSGLLNRNGSGGIINGITGHAVRLNNARNVTLRQMSITNTAAGGDCPASCASNAVESTGGGNIVLSAVSMAALGGHGWNAANITGVNRFDRNGAIDGWNASQASGIRVVNTDTDFTSFTIDRALFTTSATGGPGVSVSAHGTTTGGTVTITDSEFTAIDQNAVQINNNGSGTLTARVQRNSFHDANALEGDGNNTLYLTNHGSGQLNFTVGGPTAAHGNTFRNLARRTVLAGVVQVDSATFGTEGSRLNGSIQHNTISNDPGVANGRRAIDIQVESNASTHGGHSILIADNTVTNIAKQGLSITLATLASGNSTNNNLTVRNNTFTNVGTEGSVDSGSAIEIESNADAADVESNVAANILLEGNTAFNDNTSGVGSTLEITNRAMGVNNTSVFHVTARRNSLINAATTAPAEVFEILSEGTGDLTTCVDLNAGDDPASANTYTGGDGSGFELTRSAGTFSIAGMDAVPQSGAAVAEWLSPRNGMLTVTATGTTFVGTGTLSCTLPSLPTF